MAKKTDDDHNEWKGRIRRMKDFQKKNSRTWKQNEALLWGTESNETGVQRRNIFSYGWGLVKALETAIYVQNPEMLVEPYESKNLELGKILGSIVGFDVDMMDLKSIGNLGLVDCFTCGYFACIEALDTDKKKVEDDGEEMEVVQTQNYEARRIAPKDLLVHPACTRIDLSDSPYVASFFYPTIREIRDNPIFEKKNLPDDLDDYPEAASENRGEGREFAKAGTSRAAQDKEKDPDFKTIAVLEVLDKVHQKVIYITDHKNKELGSIPWPVRFKLGNRDLYPITIMAFHPMPNKFYPKPELDLIAQQLMMLNKLDQVIYEDAVTKWRKHATIGGLFTADQLAKITDTTVANAVLEATREVIDDLAGTQHNPVDMERLIVPIKDPEPKKDMLVVRDMIKQEITDIIGYGPPDRGGMPKTRSAREAVAIKEKLEARLAKRSDAVADFYRAFGAKHIMFLQQTMEIDRYARVFDSAKQLVEFRQYSRDDIQGMFNFIVYAGTSAPRSTEAKRNMEIQLFTTLWPAVAAGQIPMEPVIMRLAEAMQWKGVDALLRNYKPIAKELAVALNALAQKKIPPAVIPNLSAKLVQAVLTPEEIKLILQQAVGGGGGGSAPGGASGGDSGASQEPSQPRGDQNPQQTGAAVS